MSAAEFGLFSGRLKVTWASVSTTPAGTVRVGSESAGFVTLKNFPSDTGDLSHSCVFPPANAGLTESIHPAATNRTATKLKLNVVLIIFLSYAHHYATNSRRNNLTF